MIVFESFEAAGGADPQPARSVFEKGTDLVADQPVGRSQGGQDAVTPAVETVVGGDPEISPAILDESERGVVGQTLLGSEMMPGAAVQAIDAGAAVADPEHALAVAMDRP